MQVSRWMALRNPGALLAWLGVCGLVGSTLVPFAVGRRTARIEQQAAEIASRLRCAAQGVPDGLGPDDVPTVLARFYCLLARDGLPTTDLAALPAPEGLLLLLQNRDYLFHLAAAPMDPQAIASPGSVAALEVLAWPRDERSRGHTVFFEPSDALPAYTRNLVGRHVGDGPHRPLPGQQQQRGRSGHQGLRGYRSLNNERWIETAGPGARQGGA